MELNLYSALANQGLQAQLPSIQKGYEALHQKEQDPIKWGSVLDQLDFVLPAYIEHIKASKPKEVEAAQTLSALVGAYLRPN